ncbi:GNAT family N-acetyltransferase [Saccharomonospora cyanea]|uniref:Acetyltransferase n=1 Tax=Saccharomonospora cyanea NA-134 TaxID=882082 RepID=H5XIN2_9PSEU|nr:GNAT family N-acetyltransferase [Saccharomonospora cyanea]EHR59634.1 acetyltransferase [Saccharomonospora cyanea NA-134]
MITNDTAVNQPEIREVAVDSVEASTLLRVYFDDVASRYYGRPATEAELDAAMAEDPSDALRPPHGVFLLAWHGDEPVGCVGLAPLTDGVLELGRMFVLPSARGRGLGTRLLVAAEEAARDRGATAIRLNTRHDLVEAQALYRAHGYAEIGAYTDAPYAEVFFEKRLR